MTQSLSAQLFDRAQAIMPGGVNSPVRAFSRVGGRPFFVERGEGALIHDVDGHAYIDLVMSWGALMLGHAHPRIVRAVNEAAGRGTSYGAPARGEVALAELLIDALPSLDMVRLVNSGTEATMAAMRLARAATGREIILKFNGCYHGHADSFLVQAGSGVATLGLPDSPGVPPALAALTLSMPFNDAAAVEAVFDEYGERIACIICEPIIGNAGFIPPADGFLAQLRATADWYGTLLILDEVMTGFRVAAGGAQARFDVRPDLTTLGKVIGGGLPVGAYGGRRDLMERIAPSGPVYQAGTLSGNPIAVAAGMAQIAYLRDTDPYSALEARARRLIDALAQAASSLGVPFWGDAAGAMFGWHFAAGPVRSFEDASTADGEFFARFFRAALQRGVFLPPSPFEAGFLSTAHDDSVIDQVIERLCAALTESVT